MRACISSLSRRTWRSLTNVPTQTRPFSCSRALHARKSVAELSAGQYQDEDIEVAGWVKSIRKQKRVSFLALSDGTTAKTLQAVLKPEQSEDLVHGTAVRLHGRWVASAGKGQTNELQVASVEICGQNDAESNPIQPKYQSLEFLRTVPHLRSRMTNNALLLRLRSEVIASVTSWFRSQGFVQCHTPILTSSDCEGAGEVFTVLSGEEVAKSSAEVPFFRSSKYLTVSAQLHLEAMAQAVDKVWTLSPTFRAEKSDTPRHLSEFYMLEAELCFTRSADEVMDVVENMLRALTRDVQQASVYTELLSIRQTQHDEAASADVVEARWKALADAKRWPRVTYKEAIDTLKQAHGSGDHQFTIPPSFDDGLAAEHERYLADVYGRGQPVFITRYPAKQKPFYMLPVEGESNVDCFDLLVPDLAELVGGSLREHRLDRLTAAMREKSVTGSALEWYKDLRRYGSVPHGGFGLGFDRLLCYLAGVSSVRDVVAYPRYHGKADC